MNGEHIRRMSIADLVAAVLPFARERYGEHLDVPQFEARGCAHARARQRSCRSRNRPNFLFVSDDDLQIAQIHGKSFDPRSAPRDLLDAVIGFLEVCEWGDEIDVLPVIAELGLKPRPVMHVLYTAIEGTSAGLPLFDVFARRERGVARLRGTRARPRCPRESRPVAGCPFRMIASFGLRARRTRVRVPLVTFVQVWMASRRDEARPSQAIIVLGAAQYDGRPSPVLAARLDHAIQLYRKHIAPVIVVTGGRQPGDRFTEAGASADYLHQHGIADTAILRETTGRTSWESLAAREVPRRAAQACAVLVSDPYHSARIDAIAHEVGLDAVTSPTRLSPDQRHDALQAHGRGDVRVAAGRLFGYARLDRHRTVTKLVPGLATL